MVADDELRAHDERDRLHAILEQLPFAAVVADAPSGRIAFANFEAERIYGAALAGRDTAGESAIFLADGQPPPPEDFPLVRALRQGEATTEREMEMVRHDGSRCPVLISARPVRDPEGRIIAATATFYDITALKRAEEEHRDLVRRQRAARLEVEAAHSRLTLLAEISQFLLASLDYQAAITGLARMILPALGDACFIDIEDGEGARPLAIAHINPHKAALLQRLFEMKALTALVARPLATALRSGKPERGDRITASTMDGVAAADPQWSTIVTALDPRAFMVIPLVTRGRVLGAMVFLVTDTERKYSNDDLDFAQHLARRAATAVDNLRLYEDARQARLAAEDANRLKDEFLATLSHELRTPLNAILGWARMLRSGKVDGPAADKALQTIERNALAQAQIIEDLLDVSRIITGSLRLNLQEVDLASVIDNAINTLRPAADAKGITVEEDLDRVEIMLGDQGRLQQVVWNLVSNAIKFTPTNGRVTVALKREGAQVTVRVTDSGVGISPEFLPHVFERFRQGDSTTTRVHGGLGLGLAIVRHLAELHGGTVQAESAGPGHGASFTVRLPLRPVARQPVARQPARNSGTAAEQPHGALSGVEVLVVDDEPDARELVASILRHHGAVVRVVASAQAALESLAHFKPQVLVADIAMPGEDGYALIRRVRREHSDLPAVALTAYARPEDRRRALDAGFEMHLPKPVEPDELIGAVADLSGR